MDLLFRNGTVALPEGPRVADVRVTGGVIGEIGDNLAERGETVVDARGLWVAPGLVDIHCHLREPGYEYKETIASGARAAAKGGFTSICCMANTKPVNDNAAVTALIQLKAKDAAVRVYPIAAVTKGLKGEELTEVGELKEMGVVALSDDGKPVADANRMRLALQYAKAFGMTIITHSEDLALVGGGVMNEGYWATILGLPGNPNVAEAAMIARDCLLAGSVDGRLHIAHVSTREGVEIVRRAKAAGYRVTCETAPHYLYATDAWVEGYDTNTRVNPPLRTPKDQAALIEGLKDGTIDCIATDHAPHHADEKNVEYAIAASGISGFETALSVCWTALVEPGHVTPDELFGLMSARPARVLGLTGGAIVPGAAADIVLVDPEARWTVDAGAFLSQGRNTPFDGKTLRARVVATYVGGDCKYRLEENA